MPNPSFPAIAHWRQRQQPIPISTERDSFWELYDKIEPVAIAYGAGRRVYVTEFNSAKRLLRELWRLGRRRTKIRAMISREGALTRQSVLALNCYLQHFFSAQSLNALRAGQLHRFTWYRVQSAVPLRWN